MDEIAKAFSEHVEKLVLLGTKCPDEDRRLDAIRSLAGMALLIEGWRPPEPDGGEHVDGSNVIDISAYSHMLKRAA